MTKGLALAALMHLAIAGGIWWWAQPTPPARPPSLIAIEVVANIPTDDTSPKRDMAARAPSHPPTQPAPQTPDQAPPPRPSTELRAQNLTPTKPTLTPKPAHAPDASPQAAPSPTPAPAPETDSPPRPPAPSPAPSPASSPTLSQAPQQAASAEGRVEHQPRAIANPPPTYPYRARASGLEGKVMLRVQIDRDGHPAKVVLLASSGHGLLDRAALRAIQRWRFHPAQRAGEPVPSEIDIPISFRLAPEKAPAMVGGGG